MSTTETTTALATMTEQSHELQITEATARAQHEIQSAIIIAKRFPRNEEDAYAKLMKTCKRTSFAESSAYSFPRGGTNVSGPSVNLAREAARVWGNVRYGIEIVRDTDDDRGLRAFGWDVETNSRVEQEVQFKKLVQRKRDGKTQWVQPDERDLRELTNKHGAIALRNCLLQLVPKDLIEDAMEQCRRTLENQAMVDPDAEIKKILLAFQNLRVTPAMLKQYLGHEVAQSSPAEIADLRAIYKSIADGNSTWSDYCQSEQVAEASRNRMEDLKRQHRGSGEPTANPTDGTETVNQQPPSPRSRKHVEPASDTPPGVVLNFQDEQSGDD